MALTTKQRRFIDEYLKDYNGTQAAIRAGYSKNTAAEIAYENLRKPQIAEKIEKIVEVEGMDRSERVITLAKIARNGLVNAADRIRAIEQLGKLAGDFIDRKEITGAAGGPITFIDYGLDTDDDDSE